MINRRRFLRDVSAASGAGVLGFGGEVFAAEPPPETRRIRMPKIPINICWAPSYVSEDILRAEGFTDVRFVEYPDAGKAYPGLAAGEIDMLTAFVAPTVFQIDSGNPLVVLAGTHPGCLELFAAPHVRGVRDLKGKKVGVSGLMDPGHLFIAAFVGHVGIDPVRDIQWVEAQGSDRAALLTSGAIDAFIASPPVSLAMRDRKVGHVIVNTTTDRPWSQYFCCMVTANRDFARKYPIAAKRATRAILKSSELCAADPEGTARALVRTGVAKDHALAVRALRDIPFGTWRKFDAEDSVRYYALRLHEAGLIKSNPRKIIATGTDWRFLNELKKELKA